MNISTDSVMVGSSLKVTIAFLCMDVDGLCTSPRAHNNKHEIELLKIPSTSVIVLTLILGIYNIFSSLILGNTPVL